MQRYLSVGTSALVAMMEADRIASSFVRRELEARNPGPRTTGRLPPGCGTAHGDDRLARQDAPRMRLMR